MEMYERLTTRGICLKQSKYDGKTKLFFLIYRIGVCATFSFEQTTMPDISTEAVDGNLGQKSNADEIGKASVSWNGRAS